MAVAAESRLSNGLRVITLEDHFAPICAVAIAYAVGSCDEIPGRTGLAHLVEHLMFKGSQRVGKGEHAWLIYGEGGEMNANTNYDRTIFYEALPANQLDLALFLEADRMRSLVLNEENLDNARQAIQEEHRLAVDVNPFGPSYETIKSMTYEDFRYSHSPFGLLEDLRAATVNDAEQWHRSYYGPNNAVLAIAGDFESRHAAALVDRRFGAIAVRPRPPLPPLNDGRSQRERRGTIDTWSNQSRIDIAYRLPPGNSRDHEAVRILAAILASSDDSRLYKSLVREQKAATQVFGFIDERRGPSALRFGAVASRGSAAESVEKLLLEEVSRMQNEPVSESELRRAKQAVRMEDVRMRESTLLRARVLAEGAAMYRNPGVTYDRVRRLLAVTPDHIQRSARLHLRSDARAVLYTLPR